MTALILPRRKVLLGMLGLVAAPAIVRATSIMPVRAVPPWDSEAEAIKWLETSMQEAIEALLGFDKTKVTDRYSFKIPVRA